MVGVSMGFGAGWPTRGPPGTSRGAGAALFQFRWYWPGAIGGCRCAVSSIVKAVGAGHGGTQEAGPSNVRINEIETVPNSYRPATNVNEMGPPPCGNTITA